MLKNAISLNPMILFSPAKINIGLRILDRRKDGFHNLQSIMYPVGLCDILEISESKNSDQGIQFTQSGIQLEEGSGKNLCVLACEKMKEKISLPPLDLHLHKQIPVGAGLGGGSSNASTTLKALNSISGHPVSENLLLEMAADLGSDCPFFLYNHPMMMEGRGEILSVCKLDLPPAYLVLLFPNIHVSTQEAYAGVQPKIPAQHLKDLVNIPLGEWKNHIRNDFEHSLFESYPLLSELKKKLYSAGALYASMSGSGSALYGIFSSKPDLSAEIITHIIWEGPLDKSQVLS
jgi:4-diphosphocytidyl-2-C-methyl-D-erythritol kinase